MVNGFYSIFFLLFFILETYSIKNKMSKIEAAALALSALDTLLKAIQTQRKMAIAIINETSVEISIAKTYSPNHGIWEDSVNNKTAPGNPDDSKVVEENIITGALESNGAGVETIFVVRIGQPGTATLRYLLVFMNFPAVGTVQAGAIMCDCSFLFGTPSIINNYLTSGNIENKLEFDITWLSIYKYNPPPTTPQDAEQTLIDKILNSDSYDNFKNHIETIQSDHCAYSDGNGCTVTITPGYKAEFSAAEATIFTLTDYKWE
jgi:hypothetical protein